MAKFFVEAENIQGEEVTITGTDVNHIKNVLRLSEGKEIVINNGQGYDYKCIIKTIGTEKVIAQIVESTYSDVEPNVKTILFQSLIKGEKMEFVIQKGVEIGVTAIVPIITERCVVKLETEKKQAGKIERWQKIAESAAKQSGRGIVPQILKPMTYKEAISYACKEKLENCIPFEHETAHHIKPYLQGIDALKIGIFIGPEGGFTDEEIAYATAHQVSPITLGKRILRSETAGLVVLANIMYEMEEIHNGRS